MAFLDQADAYVARNGLDLPEEPDARKLGPNPECMDNPIPELDLAKAGLTSIIWATGYSVDYSWLKVDTFDENGRPKHQRGVSVEPGIYFLGLPWQSRRAPASSAGYGATPGTWQTAFTRSAGILSIVRPRNASPRTRNGRNTAARPDPYPPNWSIVSSRRS
jgi:hypothetical protein